MIGTQYGESNNRKRLISLVTYYYIMTPSFKIDLEKTDFQEGKLTKTDIEGKSIVLVMLNGKLFAIDSRNKKEEDSKSYCGSYFPILL